MLVWPNIERFITEQGAAVLVTLVEARGSSPREVGARLIVRPDGGFSGTIGGGTLEWMALAEAQLLLSRAATRSVRRLDQALGPDLGQCCGGRVTLTLERFGPADQKWVATLAAAERMGCLVTIGTQEGARIVRSPLAAEANSSRPAPCTTSCRTAASLNASEPTRRRFIYSAPATWDAAWFWRSHLCPSR